jgi:NAD(P)H-hydrate epimerase
VEVLTGEAMRRVDRRAIDEMGIPGVQLMEAAGRGVAEALLADFADLAASGTWVVCGKGNNGGDGFVAARHLHLRGLPVRVWLLARGEDLHGDAATNFVAARDAGVEIREIPDAAAWSAADAERPDGPLLLDAVLGTGVRGGPRGLAALAIEAMNAGDATVASIDVPSGLDADSSRVDGLAVEADRTYTLCRPKTCVVLDPAARHAGSLRVIPIGIPDEAVAPESTDLEWIDGALAAALLPLRETRSHKGTYGHLLAVAGSTGKSGAAVLLARGALRSGVGLMTVATGASNLERVAVQQAELMTAPLTETRGGALARVALDEILELAVDRDALAVGPGIDTGRSTRALVRRLLAERPCPMVLDADGLNAFAASADTRKELRAGRQTLVLTPHPGEASRLLGWSIRRVQEDRAAAARRLAARTGAVVVLKGHGTLVAGPDGALAVNSTGNPGMASGGTGDVLTGAIGAFLARGLSGFDAARLGVWVHGAAGDRAAAAAGEDGLIASDVVERLPVVLRDLQAGRRRR